MSKRNANVLVSEMQDAVESILSYTKGMNQDGFAIDKKTKDAVLRNLIVLGEAVTRLPAEFRELHPQIEWEKIARSRHVIVHDYFDVDYEIIWKIVTVYLPDLKVKLAGLISPS